MNGRTVLITILVLIALPLYGWNIYLLVEGVQDDESSQQSKEVPSLKGNIEEYVYIPRTFVAQKKSPFQQFKTKPKKKIITPVDTVKTPVPQKKEIPLLPPRLTVTGIMWNKVNPIAMVTLPNGKQDIAKIGHTLGGIEILAIEQNRLQVRYKDNKFWISK